MMTDTDSIEKTPSSLERYLVITAFIIHRSFAPSFHAKTYLRCL